MTTAEGRCHLELVRQKGAFGFKGHATINPLGSWHVVSMLRSTSGKRGIGLANEGCMWSDAAVTLANGAQNYTDWEIMRRDLPYPDAPWTQVRGGVYELDDDYWAKSGGVLAPLPRHEALFA